MNEKQMLSVIAPCFNEEATIETFTIEVTKALQNIDGNKYTYEIIFIDDGSKDSTLEKIIKFAEGNNKIRYISFSRNFGKESAMLAGLRYATGDCVVIMDCDLQHPPSLIQDMLCAYEEGYDQVIAKRSRKGDPKRKRLCTWIYYRIASKLVDVAMVDGAGDFRLFSRKAVEAILSLKEANRFSKGLFSWIGFKQKYIEYDNIDRAAGSSKWSFGKLVKYGIDGIISFNVKPLRICIYSGLIIIALCFIYLIYLFVRIATNGIDVPGYFTTIFIVSLIGGVQLVSVGVIGEYVGRIYDEVKKRPGYIVKETNISSHTYPHA